MIIGVLAGATALLAINLLTHVSAHTSIWALLTGSMLVSAPPLALGAGALTLIAGWPRVRVEAHTRWQALALPWAVAAATALPA